MTETSGSASILFDHHFQRNFCWPHSHIQKLHTSHCFAHDTALKPMENHHPRALTIYSWLSNPSLTPLPSMQYIPPCFPLPPRFSLYPHNGNITGTELLKYNSSPVDTLSLLLPVSPCLHLIPISPCSLSCPVQHTPTGDWSVANTRCFLQSAASILPLNATITTLPSIFIRSNFFHSLWGYTFCSVNRSHLATSHPFPPFSLTMSLL